MPVNRHTMVTGAAVGGVFAVLPLEPLAFAKAGDSRLPKGRMPAFGSRPFIVPSVLQPTGHQLVKDFDGVMRVYDRDDVVGTFGATGITRPGQAAPGGALHEALQNPVHEDHDKMRQLDVGDHPDAAGCDPISGAAAWTIG